MVGHTSLGEKKLFLEDTPAVFLRAEELQPLLDACLPVVIWDRWTKEIAMPSSP